MTAHQNRGYLHPFWNGNIYLYGVGELPRTLTELAMCQFSASIRSVNGWQTRVQDSKIRKVWRRKANKVLTVRTSSGPSDVHLSPRQIEYVLDELSGYVALYDAIHHCQVSCFDRIWESTASVDPALLLRLNESLHGLRAVIEQGREMGDSDHPPCTCFDLVDPSICPLVYGRTLGVTPEDELHPVAPPEPSEEAYTLSPNFAWLPTLFSIAPAVLPLTTHALSYISGIDPSLSGLYAHLEALLATIIPLFEHVLTDLSRDNPLPHRIPGDCKYTEWDEPEEPEHSDDEEGWLNYQRQMRHWTLHRPIQYPDVPSDGYRGGLELRHSQISLRGKKAMIFTKITDIHLLPDAPSYEGTPWHAEGMRNEHIAAIAIVCISMNNIIPPKVDIRIPVRSPRQFLPGDVGATSRAWGLNAGAASHQYVGSPTLELGHTIAFPNIYQHRLTKAELKDNNKEGSMTIVSFFLVDPEMSQDAEVVSTATVPPQQVEWIRKALEASLDLRVPVEIIDRILSFVDGLMTAEEASQYAAQMRKEREAFWVVHDQQWFSLPFNIWEN